MSFWKALGKIGSVAAAPFTGGMSLSAIPVLDAIGGIAGGAAQGSANQRTSEVPGQVAAYNANLNAQGMQDRRAALSSLLDGGLQDASISRPAGSTIPTFGVSGGLRPSAMNQQALLAQLGQKIQPLELPKAGMAEKVLGGVGLGSSVLSALGGIQKKKATPQAEPVGQSAFGASGFVDPGAGQRNPFAMY
jgi:hypothetical protein